jgi:hypothetical protein
MPRLTASWRAPNASRGEFDKRVKPASAMAHMIFG